MTTVGYLGPAGTFTELAYRRYTDEQQLSCTPFVASSLSHLFEAFRDQRCDAIVVPIENSIEGFVSSSLDLLVEHKHGLIAYELILPIEHCLLAPQGLEIGDLTHVLSHTQALSQCQRYLDTHLAHATTLPVASTATAAQWISSPETRPESLCENGSCAAIGNERLADLYPLTILARGINDKTSNQTRFFVLSHHPSVPSGHDKTSIVFTTDDKPGSLYAIMGDFAAHQINLTHISSRPKKSALGEYLFFIDFEGHQEDEIVKRVLADVAQKTHTLKVLGSYKKG